MEEGEYTNDKIAGDEREFLRLDKEELIKKYIDVRSALQKAELEISIYRNLLLKSSNEHQRLKSKIQDISQTEYNHDWSWVNKIVFVLKKINRPLLSHEIIDFIIPHEPVLQRSRHRAQAFSANLNKAVKYDRVRTYKLHGSRGYYYVLPGWLDIDGHLINEYEDKIFFK